MKNVLRHGRKKTALLTDDLLVEIFARVPYRSLCSFRCVCTRWRAVIAHPDHRARLPQTLTGFLYSTPSLCDSDTEFGNVSATGHPFIDASFSFLPDRELERLDVVDSCNGLLLCRRYRPEDDHELDYLVLNPVTERWVTVPLTPRWPMLTIRLGFDPAVSPHFYVFEFLMDDEDEEEDDWDGDGDVLSLKIYYSATGVWVHHRTDQNIALIDMRFKSVFLNGVLYVNAINYAIGAVDVEGENWRIILVPPSEDTPVYGNPAVFIDQSQGWLHLAMAYNMDRDKLAIMYMRIKTVKMYMRIKTVKMYMRIKTVKNGP